jgi:hypothetical protein
MPVPYPPPAGSGAGIKGVRFAASINHTPKPMMKIVTRIFIAVMTWLTWELSFMPITRIAVTAMITSTAMKSWENPSVAA